MKKCLIYLLILSFWRVGAQTSNITPKDLRVIENQYREAKKMGDSKAISDAASLAGDIHLQLKNYKRSVDYLLVAKAIYKTEKNTKNLAKVSCRLAENYYRSGNNKRYKDYITLAQQLIGKDTLSAEYLLLLDTQIGYFRAKKKLPQAQYLIDRKAQLQRPAATPKLREAEIQAPVVSKPVQGEQKTTLKPNVEPYAIRNEKGIDDVILALAVAVAAFSFGGLIYYFYKDHRRKLGQRTQFNAMQSQLLENIAQAIRNSGSTQTIANQLNQLSEITAEKKQPDFNPESIGPLLQATVAPFQRQAEQQNIAVISNIETSSEAHLVDKETVENILSLLWTEALSHSKPQNSLYFSAMIDKKQLDIRISYPCGTIGKDQLSRLFESFYNASAEYYPNPVGFALLDALVTWYDGKIDATLDGDLLRISIRLPLTETRRQPKLTPALVL